MLEKIKANMFTLHGLITSLLHVLLLVGALTGWIGFQVQVLGNDVEMSLPSRASLARK